MFRAKLCELKHFAPPPASSFADRFLLFQIVANYYGANKTLEYIPGKRIHWSGDRLEPPPDTPTCGFDGSLCPDNCETSLLSIFFFFIASIAASNIKWAVEPMSALFVCELALYRYMQSSGLTNFYREKNTHALQLYTYNGIISLDPNAEVFRAVNGIFSER